MLIKPVRSFEHTPVLYRQTVDFLRPISDGKYIDGTFGAGGHTRGILEASAPNGQVLAFDKDPEAIMFGMARMGEHEGRITAVNANYADMETIAPAHGFEKVDGILLDLGLSSRQLDDAQRGFSFMREGPLDMRFDSTQGETAADLINNLTESELADIIWRYGEERRSRKMARLIIANRPLFTTRQLAELIADKMSNPRRRIHPATQLFQALRIAVNHELEAVERGIPAAINLLKPGGRIAVISFHSLEDRFVKRLFRNLAKDCICPPRQPICTCDVEPTLKQITRKPIQANEQEIKENPRSRSARLRAAERAASNKLQ